jgi:hypothetical protein
MFDPKSSVRNYRASRELLNQLSWDSYSDDWGPAMRHLFFCLITASDPERCRDQAGYNQAIADGLLEKALILRDVFVPISDRYDEKIVFRDVYELATYISLSGGGQWKYDPTRPQYFRGQAREWPLVPSILRHCQNSDDLSAAIERLSRFVRTLQRVRPAVTDEQAVAVAQHYSSGENELWTWLLDVTRDPLVGLFFASLGGKTGDHGVLWQISEKEWNRLSGCGSNLLGAIRAVEAPGIHRIRVQKGLFIDTSHPELFGQYVPYSMKFQQIEGLVFEDHQSTVPITRDFLLKDDDDIEAIIQRSKGGTGSPRVICPHQLRPTSSLTARDYFEIVKSWVQNNPEWRIDETNGMLLDALCDLHAQIQQLSVHVRDRQMLSDLIDMGNLHNLWRGVESVFNPLGRSILDHNYLVRTDDPQLKEMLLKVANPILSDC